MVSSPLTYYHEIHIIPSYPITPISKIILISSAIHPHQKDFYSPSHPNIIISMYSYICLILCEAMHPHLISSTTQETTIPTISHRNLLSSISTSPCQITYASTMATPHSSSTTLSSVHHDPHSGSTTSTPTTPCISKSTI